MKNRKSEKDTTLEESGIKTPEEIKEDEDDFPQSKMAISTNSDTIKDYVNILFEKMEGREEDFISNLSTPLQRNPLEILMHLQNTYYELEECEQLPYQQSVLPVDIYLDIERGRRKVEEETLEENKKKAREEHELQKKLNPKPDKEKDKEEAKELEEKKEDKEGEKDEENSDSMSSFTKDEELDTKLFNLK